MFWDVTMNKISRLFLALLACTASTTLSAIDDSSRTFADHTVRFSAFNSSFLSPEVAGNYNITRGKNRGLVNIAVIPLNAGAKLGGQPALVEGSVSNIIAQRQILDFFEVTEGAATYYLAPFRFENEDFLTFKIRVRVEPDKPANEMSFQRTFYHDK
jgi:hypothetical protein